MPLLYGEGSKAFMRLQHEILQTQENDESIFAWTDAKTYNCGLLAQSPAAFALSGNIEPVKNPNPSIKPPIVTKKLLKMDGLDSLSEYQLHDSIQYTKNPSPYIVLNCVQQGIDSSIIGIELTARDLDYFAMPSSETLEQSSSYLDYFTTFPSYLPLDRQQQFATILPSLTQHGFASSEKYPEDVRFVKLPSVFPLNTRPEGWKVILDLSLTSVAALMFRSKNEEAFALIVSAKESGVSVNVIVPKQKENLKDIVNKDLLFLERGTLADRSSRHLQVKHDVCATSRKRFVNYETVYFIDVRVSETDSKASIPEKSRQRHLQV